MDGRCMNTGPPLPQPPKTNQKVPMNSAASLRVNGVVDFFL